jgi:heme-degrading monooxygenase HmoA
MVRLINCFEVPAGREEEFFAAFQKVNAYMRAKKGYVGHKMWSMRSRRKQLPINSVPGIAN